VVVRYVLILVLSLLAHAAAVTVLPPYRDLVFAAGLPLTHGHDVADIPDVFAAGFAVTAPVVAALGLLVDRALRAGD